MHRIEIVLDDQHAAFGLLGAQAPYFSHPLW
jgi:hypothetical protein